MPSNEPTSTTYQVDDWHRAWVASLLEDSGPREIAEQLVIRWQRNVPSMAPRQLRPPRSANQDTDWSIWLERFLLSGGPDATECAAKILKCVETALETFPRDLSRIVWFRDIAALRRVAFADDQTRRAAAKIVVETFSQLNGVSAEADMEQFLHLEKLYSVTTNCLVSELYEEDVTQSQFRTGMAGGSFEDFTVIWQLENLRSAVSEPNAYEEPNYSAELPQWLPVVELYQQTADSLFDTLFDISAQAESTGDLVTNRSSFLSFLTFNFSKPPRKVNDFLKYTGYQRVLDIHWLRLGAIVSRDRKGLASQVRRFILFVSEGQISIHSKIRRCTFSSGFPLSLKSKNDPLKTIKVTFVNAENDSPKIEITYPQELAELVEGENT